MSDNFFILFFDLPYDQKLFCAFFIHKLFGIMDIEKQSGHVE